MAKVQKTMLEVKVVDMGGHEFTVTDTAEAKAGSLAFQKFMAMEIVPIKGQEEGQMTYVPFESVDHVEVTRTTEETEVTDDTCVEEEETVEP